MLHKGEGTHIVYAVDFTSRNVIGHCFTDSPIDGEAVTKTLTQAFKDRSFLPNVSILHLDRKSLYKNIPYEELLGTHGIQFRVSLAEKFHNRVIDRSFGTVKQYMRNDMGLDAKDHIVLNQFPTFKEKADYVFKMIEFYNNHAHESLSGLSPNTLEQALLEQALFKQIKQKKQASKDEQDKLPFLVENDESQDKRQENSEEESPNESPDDDEEANIVRAYKCDAVEGFVNLHKGHLTTEQFQKKVK